MRILITGANGFLGSHLVRRLADEHTVTAVSRRMPSEPVSGVEYVVQDISEPLDFGLLPNQIDAVIHQAALIDTESLDNDDAAAFLTNVVGTWRMLNYALRVGAQRFVHASTGGVYGHSDEPLREVDPHAPMDLYALTKAQAELLVRYMPVPFPKIILRYFLPYGLGTPNPIPDFLRAVLRGDEVEIADDRGPQINPIHVTDAVEATVRALSLREDTTLNIAGVENTTFAALAEFAAERAGLTAHFVEQSRAEIIPYYRKDLIGSTELMQKELSFRPTVTLREGLAELVDGLVQNSPGSESTERNSR